MILIWILFVLAVIAFVVLFCILNKKIRKLPDAGTKVFLPVYAGCPEECDKEIGAIEISLVKFNFRDENDNTICLDDYEGYVAEGDSMELANIKNGDLMLVHKNYEFHDSTPLPNIFVLKREHKHENEAGHKLRRVWAVINLTESDICNVIKGISAHPAFIKLQQNKEFCVDNEQMLNEFFGEKGRLYKYKKDHPLWNQHNCSDSRVIISTTLRTNKEGFNTGKGKHISFSIHPANLVVGQVSYVYSKELIKE